MIHRKIPAGCGWILDDFPSSYNQAKVKNDVFSRQLKK